MEISLGEMLSAALGGCPEDGFAPPTPSPFNPYQLCQANFRQPNRNYNPAGSCAFNVGLQSHNSAPARVAIPEKQGEVVPPGKTKGSSSSTPPVKKRARNKVPNPDAWEVNIRKKAHAEGKEYISRRGKKVGPKVVVTLKNCLANCQYRCLKHVPEEKRKEINKAYYSLKTQTQKRDFLIHTTVRCLTKRPKNMNPRKKGRPPKNDKEKKEKKVKEKKEKVRKEKAKKQKEKKEKLRKGKKRGKIAKIKITRASKKRESKANKDKDEEVMYSVDKDDEDKDNKDKDIKDNEKKSATESPTDISAKTNPPNDSSKSDPPNDLSKSNPPNDLSKSNPPNDLSNSNLPSDLSKTNAPNDSNSNPLNESNKNNPLNVSNINNCLNGANRNTVLNESNQNNPYDLHRHPFSDLPQNNPFDLHRNPFDLHRNPFDLHRNHPFSDINKNIPFNDPNKNMHFNDPNKNIHFNDPNKNIPFNDPNKSIPFNDPNKTNPNNEVNKTNPNDEVNKTNPSNEGDKNNPDNEADKNNTNNEASTNNANNEASKAPENESTETTPVIKPSRRKYTFKYYFYVNEQRVQVCKAFYLGTLNISQSPIYSAHETKNPITNTANEDMRGKNPSCRRKPEGNKDFAREHIRSFPTVKSHCCVASKKMKYLDGHLSIAKMFDLYLQKCIETRMDPVKKSMYHHIFSTEFNLSFLKPPSSKSHKCHS